MPYWTEEDVHFLGGCAGECGELKCRDKKLMAELELMNAYERRQIMALENIAYEITQIRYHLESIQSKLE
jgi:anthranilate/para-aminobenzoate synthase component II